MATRPTTDKVRQALFAILADIDAMRVADLFAGSGALGIEALSRGACSCCFVESSRPALQVLHRNTDTLGLADRCKILPLRVERAATSLAVLGPFDLVFVDPPWVEVPRVLKWLARREFLSLLAADGLFLLEHPSREPLPPLLPDSLHCVQSRQWGDTAVSWLRPAVRESEP